MIQMIVIEVRLDHRGSTVHSFGEQPPDLCRKQREGPALSRKAAIRLAIVIRKNVSRETFQLTLKCQLSPL